MKQWLWQGKPWQAFKTFALLFSFTINLVLLLVLLLLAPQLLPTVDSVGKPLVGGLSDSFVQMGDAHIVQTIYVDDTLDIDFSLPLSNTTTVFLTQPVPLTAPATFNFPGGGGSINGTVTLNLPPGLALPIALNMDIPVRQTIPVQLEVPVAIPLAETDLGLPFGTLEALFIPLDAFVDGLPGSNDALLDRLRTDTMPAAPDEASLHPAP